MARTLVNAHQLAPFSGSSATQVKFGSDTYSGGLSMNSGSISSIEALLFDGGGKLQYSDSAIQLEGDVRTTGALTVEGNLVVNGTSLVIESTTIAVEDSLIEMAKDNRSSDSLDIGFYGVTGHSSNPDKYHGLFRDATDGKFRLFKELQVQPSGNVGTSDTGYQAADLIVGSLEIGHDGDSTLSRASGGDLQVEGNIIYRAAGTDVPVTDGGTGASNAGAARTNLGVAIGSDVQAYDNDLADIAALGHSDGGFMVSDGTDWIREDGATARASMGVTIGTHVQAFDTQLATLAGFTAEQVTRGIADQNLLTANDAVADNDWLRINGTEVEGRNDAELIADLSLEIGVDLQAWDTQLDAVAGWSAQQVIRGIANDNTVEVDQADIQSGDWAKFTGNGLSGRSNAEILSDLSGQAAADFSMNSRKLTSVLDPTANQDAATKAYVDAQLTDADLDFAGDSGGPQAVDLDSQSLTFAGGSGISSVGSGQTITYNLAAQLVDVASLSNSDGNIIVGNGSNFVAESGNIARTSLGLGTGNNVEFTNLEAAAVTAESVTVAASVSGSGGLRLNVEAVSDDYTAGLQIGHAAEGAALMNWRNNAGQYEAVWGSYNATSSFEAASGKHMVIKAGGNSSAHQIMFNNTDNNTIAWIDGAGGALFSGVVQLQADFKASDNSNGKIMVGNNINFAPRSMGGDATLDNNAQLSIGANRIVEAMIADNAVGADQLANNAVDTAAIQDNAVTLAKMAGLVSANFILGSAGGDPTAVTMSGDATLANNGALSIGANKVVEAMIADNAVGADQLANDAVDTAAIQNNAVTLDKMAGLTSANFIVGNGSNDPGTVTMGGDITMTNSGNTSIGSNKVVTAMVNDNVADELAQGDGLSASSGRMSVDLNGSGGLEFNGNSIQLNPSVAGNGLSHNAGVLKVDFEREVYVSDSASGYTSGTRTFALSYVPVANSEQVYLNGQLLSKGSDLTNGDYTVAGQNVQLHSELALDSDDVAQIRYLK